MQSDLLIMDIKVSEPMIIVHITEVSVIMSNIEAEFAKSFITRTNRNTSIWLMSLMRFTSYNYVRYIFNKEFKSLVLIKLKTTLNPTKMFLTNLSTKLFRKAFGNIKGLSFPQIAVDEKCSFKNTPFTTFFFHFVSKFFLYSWPT